MARRALVLGSQIEGLRGVDNDCCRMAALLDARGFAVDLRTGDAATRDGMLAGYDQLISASSAEDAAVVYYCGHGYHARVPDEGRSWQCIAPTDLRAGTVADWRGITAWELSIKQAQLTERTRNVTVILDCCHSAQLSRSDGVEGAILRALPHPVQTGFDRHLAALRATYGAAFDAVHPVGNPYAVRVVACGQSESAFEYPDAAGEYHGVFTEVLSDVLTQVGTASVSWAAIIGAIRARVLRRFVRQRPDLEGPTRRAVFSLAEQEDLHSVAVAVDGGSFRLSAGQLTGAAVGDVYAVLPPGLPILDDRVALARLEIVEVSPTMASAHRIAGVDPIPADAVAVRIRRGSARWAVAIDAVGAARAAVEQALAGSHTLRTAQPGEHGALATVRIERDAVAIHDAGGPLFLAMPFPSDLDRALAQVANLGVAQGLRELEGEHGVQASELAIELGAVRDGRRQRLPDHGAVFGTADRYYVHLESRTQRTLFVHLLGISPRGKITLLTHFARGGVALDPRAPSVTIGQRSDGALVGVGLRWPEGFPETAMPRLTEFVVIATLTSMDLSSLETRDVGTLRSGRNEFALALLCDRTCQTYRSESGARALDGFLVKRLAILLTSDPHGTGARGCESS
jgi:hypothetical protein